MISTNFVYKMPKWINESKNEVKTKVFVYFTGSFFAIIISKKDEMIQIENEFFFYKFNKLDESTTL